MFTALWRSRLMILTRNRDTKRPFQNQLERRNHTLLSQNSQCASFSLSLPSRRPRSLSPQRRAAPSAARWAPASSQTFAFRLSSNTFLVCPTSRCNILYVIGATHTGYCPGITNYQCCIPTGCVICSAIEERDLQERSPCC
jgi:hypothetical protein